MKKVAFMAVLLGILAIVGFVVFQRLKDLPAGTDVHEESVIDEEDIRDTARSKLLIEDIKVGEGRAAEKGDMLTVHYTGMLEDGIEFDSSIAREEPITFELASGKLIQGFDLGVEGMRVGGIRKVVIPPELAYGEREIPGIIPANSTLIFDITLLDIQVRE